ncbi:MAG TPA: phosphoenolpyruvate carboxylase [Rickettsiales bacterium]|nr:phosphoenolpyruvate carboxylase [Rickettsiales bacterium]
MPIALRDNDADHEIRSIITELNDYTRTSATAHGLLKPNDDWFFNLQPADTASGFMQTATEMAQHTNDPDSCLRVAEYMGANRIVLNALGYFYRASVTPSPQERFETFIREGLRNPDTRDSFLDTLEAARDKMIISIVQTMHPTIYHTKFARERETALTATLEQISETISSGGDTLPLIAQAKSHIDALTTGMVAGEQITPDKPVTVAEENTLDRENHEKMRTTFENVIQDFNTAVQTVAATSERRLTEDQAERLRNVKIDPKQLEYRTWAYAADADGRDKATSIELYRGIYRQVKEGDTEYKSRKRDPRENAKDHMNAVSCLLQVAGQDNPAMEGYLGEFGLSDTRILQELDKQKQQELLRELVATDNHFSSDFHDDMETIKAGTIAFNRMFAEKYPQFLEENGLSPYTDLEALKTMKIKNPSPSEPRFMLQKLCNFIADQEVTVTEGEEPARFRISPHSLTYERDRYHRHSQFFSNKLIKDGSNIRDLTDSERRKLLDVIKRLQVLDHAIDQFGNKVADRYQIANFAGAEDFYSTLLLFKQTGIIAVENGQVTSPKLSIQPLLETAEDQAMAPAMFEKLLEDPLVVSYYRALGNKADIMFGYSDGAKSAGNFASEWSIRQNARKLYDIFAAHGIELQVFHGRGRGDSRGGQFDLGQDQRMMDPALARGMRYDETQQSDLPLAGATSQRFEQDMCASTLTGITTAGWEARRSGDNPPYRQDDRIIDELAATSEQTYKTLIYNSEETRKLLGVIHDNPYKSSRAAARNTQPDSLDKIRAITVEYGFNMVDAPLHYIGTKAALEKYINDHPDGIETLKELYHTHPFFQGMMDKTAQGLIDYNPQVFHAYAEAIGITQWADKCIAELDGMRDLVQQVREQTQVQKLAQGPRANPRQNSSDTITSQAALLEQTPLREEEKKFDKMVHALPIAYTIKNGHIQPITEEHNPFRSNDPKTAKTMLLATFGAACRLPAKMLQTPAQTRARVDGMSVVG